MSEKSDNNQTVIAMNLLNLVHGLRDHLVTEEYIRWAIAMNNDSKSAVRTPVGITDPFAVKKGIHQENTVSASLILVMDTFIRHSNNPASTIIAYADDILLTVPKRAKIDKHPQEKFKFSVGMM